MSCESLAADWKIFLRRTKNHSAEIEKTFGRELFIVLCLERKLKDTLFILHSVINYITTGYPIT